MNTLLIILALLFSSLLIVAVVYILMKQFLKQNLRQMEFLNREQDLVKLRLEIDRKKQTEKTSMAIRFQAYERMALFLERINPPNLIPRIMTPGQSAGGLQAQLHRSIRDEYEHNLSQQLYISDVSWVLVQKAKEEVTGLVNLVASKVKSDEDGGKFASEMLTIGFVAKNNPIDVALDGLKEEIRKGF
ncbi:MAG: hypothetical protein DRI89_09690 [Bacteroidetes bacterium]|nr:MAG: hypothetical protein DRI89_09690 [Bacteroidota bacterium]